MRCREAAAAGEGSEAETAIAPAGEVRKGDTEDDDTGQDRPEEECPAAAAAALLAALAAAARASAVAPTEDKGPPAGPGGPGWASCLSWAASTMGFEDRAAADFGRGGPDLSAAGTLAICWATGTGLRTSEGLNDFKSEGISKGGRPTDWTPDAAAVTAAAARLMRPAMEVGGAAGAWTIEGAGGC